MTRTHGQSNTRGVAESVFLKMSSTLSSGHDFKVFADNYFTTLPLLDELKQHQIWYVGTIWINRLSNFPLLYEKDMQKKVCGSYYYNRISVRWFDNEAVTLVPSFVDIEPVNSVRHFDRKVWQCIMIEQSYIALIYSKYMESIKKTRNDVLFLQTKHKSL